MEDIKNIILDLGGVIINLGDSLTHSVLSKLGIPDLYVILL